VGNPREHGTTKFKKEVKINTSAETDNLENLPS
jgi:hypothetical protein